MKNERMKIKRPFECRIVVGPSIDSVGAMLIGSMPR
jgi:hypothetical protein